MRRSPVAPRRARRARRSRGDRTARCLLLLCSLLPSRQAIAQASPAPDDGESSAPSPVEEDAPEAEAPPSNGAARSPADQPLEDASPAVRAPEPLRIVQPTYPKGAVGLANVVLVLVIDTSGVVTAARVHSSAGPAFDEAALAAARQSIFEPARRNGTPVVARILFESVLVPPSLEEAEAAGSVPSGGAPITRAAAASPEAVQRLARSVHVRHARRAESAR